MLSWKEVSNPFPDNSTSSHARGCKVCCIAVRPIAVHPIAVHRQIVPLVATPHAVQKVCNMAPVISTSAGIFEKDLRATNFEKSNQSSQRLSQK